MIEVKNLTYSYPHTTEPALKDINFSISAGEFVSVIGPTGAGKSTLCYCFNGVIPRLSEGKFQGSIKVAGLDTYDHDIPILAQHIGLVIQNARNQLFNVTVEGEVAFGCENLGYPPEKIKKNIAEALDFIGLTGMEDREPSSLSGGQQQRVAIACVLAMQPDVLILDEPTSELDPLGSEQVFEVIYRLNRELGKTVLLVSHETEYIARYSDRVIVLNEGQIVIESTAQDVFSNEEFLRKANIRPPQVSDVAFALQARGYPVNNNIPINLKDALLFLSELE